MAHDHSYSITFLKTPFGYFTKTGFTQDINSKDIILLPSNSYGKWSSMMDRIEYFFQHYEGELPASQLFKLYHHASECETIAFHCTHGTHCDGCRYASSCSFWHGDRAQLELGKIDCLYIE